MSAYITFKSYRYTPTHSCWIGMATLEGVNRVLTIKVINFSNDETFYKQLEDDNYQNKIISQNNNKGELAINHNNNFEINSQKR